ncbi:hypothetical protein CY34DRAFT_8650 [Suillus luteus UH-Slu-Lm8-n1]|uniref:HAT C-terminal dimerisation domain-containing protein n=1 Tax=Suillus luteus UH-Slu-Lm8-n1 TaxID=930992 RepID=A0A0D0BPY7_9AGAM|nr:hypothetical protein CY34DRAFT_8650 [Suillus luteus UH-Slu-Lm8-n1]
MSTETKHRVACPVRKIKPTAALLQHAEKAALPSQTKAIHNFRTAEAAERAAEHASTSSPTETVESPRTSPIPSASSAVNPRKRVCPEDSDGESGDDERENAHTNPKPQKQHKSAVVPAEPELVNADGILIDIDVQSLMEPVSTREAKTADINAFFGATFDHTGANGKVKKHRKCKTCPKACILINKISTLRCHTEAKFSAKYRKWAKEYSFELMLPGNVKARKDNAAQQSINVHLTEQKLAERVVSYTDKLFKQAAIEWLVSTNQPIQVLEHPKFKEMIDIAARATNSVKIPGRKATCVKIMRTFKTHLMGLRSKLNISQVYDIALSTQLIWTYAENTDGYFAVTGHWIEEKTTAQWELEINNAHTGKHLGGALFKILDRVGVTHKTLISSYSKSPHYNPHDLKAHELSNRDEIGLVRSICVKEHSPAKRKELYQNVQIKGGVSQPTQLLINIKVRWSSTYIMLNRAEMNKEHIDMFVYEMGRQERDLARCVKIDFLQLSNVEWTHVRQFADLLLYADVAQQAFSSERGSTLHLAIPALETLHKAWSSCTERSKYAQFAPALKDAAAKVDEYYEKTTHSTAYVLSMWKMSYFKKHWPEYLHDDVLSTAETVFKARYIELNQVTSSMSQHTTKPSRTGSLKKLIREVLSDSEDDSSTNPVPTSIGDPTRLWRAEFLAYLETVEAAPPSGMSTIQWWGINAQRYPIWASLARDYLAIMSSSVFSEWAFSQGGITITKQRNRLKADIIEALQCVKCALRQDLLFQEPAPSSLVELEHLDNDDEEVEVDILWPTVQRDVSKDISMVNRKRASPCLPKPYVRGSIAIIHTSTPPWDFLIDLGWFFRALPASLHPAADVEA